MERKPASTNGSERLLVALRSPLSVVGRHLSEEEQIAYALEELSSVEIEDADRHLETCPECSDSVFRLTEASSIWVSEDGRRRLEGQREAILASIMAPYILLERATLLYAAYSAWRRTVRRGGRIRGETHGGVGVEDEEGRPVADPPSFEWIERPVITSDGTFRMALHTTDERCRRATVRCSLKYKGETIAQFTQPVEAGRGGYESRFVIDGFPVSGADSDPPVTMNDAALQRERNRLAAGDAENRKAAAARLGESRDRRALSFLRDAYQKEPVPEVRAAMNAAERRLARATQDITIPPEACTVTVVLGKESVSDKGGGSPFHTTS